MLYPPVLLSPELVKLGAYHVLVNEPAAAIQAYQDALKAYPNDMDALRGLQRAYEAAKQPAQAAEVAEKIKRQMAP
jgi:tetratricopeptide (TPR) repeat protein